MAADRPLILHVGMHKTGTSSIQRSLYFGLEDPAFRLVSLGFLNAANYLMPLVGEDPADFWAFRAQGLSPARIERMRREFAKRLRRALGLAKSRSRTPIISAERCWEMPRPELERLRDLLAAAGFGVRVVAYVRPVKSYAESAFQEVLKARTVGFDPIGPLRTVGDDRPGELTRWSIRLGILEQVFGRDRLTVRPFVRSALVEGCAVRDFCRTVGVTLDPSAVIRVNESLGAEAVRFLHAYRRFLPPGATPTLHEGERLVRRLGELGGEPLRFHSSVFEPIAGAIDAEVRTIRDLYGIDLSEDLRAADGGPCVRDEADLFRFSPASLEWLARASGSRAAVAGEGEAAARAVAAQVDRIRRRPGWRTRADLFAERMRTRLRWIRHGD